MLSAELFDQGSEPLNLFLPNLSVQNVAVRFCIAGLATKVRLTGILEAGSSEVILDFIAGDAMHPGPEPPGIAQGIDFLYNRQQRFL